jgi:hypothetical protein
MVVIREENHTLLGDVTLCARTHPPYYSPNL